MAPDQSSNLRQHLATAWLLANCAVVVLWPGSLMNWWPILDLALLAWSIVAIAMLLATALWSVSLRRRAVAIATTLAATVVGWESVLLGPMFHVWWRQDVYMQQARAALANPPPPPQGGPGYIQVDHSDTPPIRVAFFFFAAHGDVAGIVYDPTGLADAKPQDWVYGHRPHHLFGPWYQFGW